MKNIVCFFIFFISFVTIGQITFTNADTITNAGEGDLYLNTDTGTYFIGLSNGGLKELGIVTRRGTADDEILVWNNTDQVWEATAPSVGGISSTSDIINTSDRARIVINPAGNINAGTTFDLVMSAFQLNQTAATISGPTISNLEGNLRFNVQLNISSATQRSNFKLQFLVNGNLENRVNGGLYARNGGNGHNETGGQFVFEYEGAALTDTFSFRLEREANTGSVSLTSNGNDNSYVFIEQYRAVPVITSISAPIDLALVQGPPGPQGPQGNVGPPGPPISAPTDVYHAAGNVAGNGIANYIQGATVSRTSAGRYTVVFNAPHPNGVNYPVLFSMEQNVGQDDYVPTYTNVTPTGFNVEIGEQDNGATAGVPVDAGFSFYVSL